MSWAEFVMGRDVPESLSAIYSQRIPEVNLMLVSTSSALYYLTNINLNLFVKLFYFAFSGT